MLTKIKGGLMLGFDNVLHTAGFRKRFFVAVAGTTTALATTFATAQANNALLEEVYVTAQKKSVAEAVQDVPIAISAYSGRKIEAMFAVDLTDIGFTAPNVQLTPQGTVPGTANFSIRGWGTTGQSIPSSDPAVGVVQDGVAFGTIYGVQDGIWDNTTIGGEQGARESLVVRPAVSFRGENSTFTAIAEFGDIDADGMSGRNFMCLGVPALVLAECAGFEPNLDPYADNTTRQTTVGENNIEWSALTLEGVWDLWNGSLTAVAGYRDMEQEVWGDIDGAPNTIRFQFAPGTGFDQEQLSLEVRWSGDISDRMTLTTGVNFFDQEYTYNERRLLIDALDLRASSTIDHSTFGVFAQADFALTDKLTVTLGGRYSSEEKDAAIGVIGDPTGTGNCKRFVGSNFGGSDPISESSSASLSDCKPAFNDSEDWSNFTPKVGLTWNISDAMMGYASYSRGFRSGGYNVRFSDTSLVTSPDAPGSTPGPYNEEVVDALEIGLKTDVGDGRGRFNVALFHNAYEDMQLSANNQSGVQSIFNAAEATMQGIELEGV
ncbi:MAG: TonB-dependent receptor, partial [Gammaproteobacteria bacterium]|nr:TonB-dependent receptor [Gammaproteobacteria bacterium]